MRSTFFGLEIGKRSLLTQRYGMDVTGQNVSNSSTTGYSRQTAHVVTTSPLWMPSVAPAGIAQQLGTGVSVQSVTRAENALVTSQIRVNLAIQGRVDQFQASYEQIETVFTLTQDGETSLDSLLTEFFAAWQALSGAPEEEANRTAVRDAGDSLCNEFHRIVSTLEEYRKELNNEIARTVDTVNTNLAQIAKLNNEIARVRGINGNPNDLEDARDLLIEEIAAVVPLQVNETSSGSMIVAVDGRVVVQDDVVIPLETDLNWENRGFVDVVYSDRPEVTIQSATGSLGAMIHVRDLLIPAFLQEFDQLAETLVSQVNGLHTRTVDGVAVGYGLDGLTGRDFFQGDSAATIELSDAVASSVRAIQAALNPVEGDGGNALAIAQLRSRMVLGAGTLTFDGFYQSLIAELGSASNDMATSAKVQDKLMYQLSNIREQERGVNLDEEFVNLIKYQQGYEAASRLINAVDEQLDRLINGTGRVGL